MEQRKIRHVKLRYDVLSVEKRQEISLSILGMFATSGDLRSVELSLVDPEVMSMGFIYRDATARMAFQYQLRALEKRHLDGVKEQRITLDTKAEGQVEKYLKHITASDGVLKQVQKAFGGEMWVDGLLRLR
ncbi:hypothetical protein EG329_014223 [Mollisiaceae sp. DMI_Dod_QoI]|nr:hypothetical protein EG329_014223 [Helotiales sp. DMI_Dod_QoI]